MVETLPAFILNEPSPIKTATFFFWDKAKPKPNPMAQPIAPVIR